MIDIAVFYSSIRGQKCLEFLRARGLWLDKMRCSTCGMWMKIMRWTECADGEVWKSTKVDCGMKRISVRKSSVFEGMKAHLWKYAVAVYEWSRRHSVASICVDSKLGRRTVLRFTFSWDPQHKFGKWHTEAERLGA